MKKSLAAVSAFAIAAGALLTPFSAVYAEKAAPVVAQAVSAPVSGTETGKNGEERMKEALAIVKSRVDIPESYSDFSYTTGENRGMKTYAFTWSDPKGNGKSYTANVRGDFITRLYTPDVNWSTAKAGFSVLSTSQCVNKAVEYACRLNPSMKGTLKKSSVEMSLFSGVVTVNFSRQNGGIDVNNNSVTVYLNKLTGEPVGFQTYNWWQNAEFKSADGILTQEQIKEIYCKEVTIKPWYRISTDDNGKKRVNIVYEARNSFAYDAHTGKHSSMDKDYEAYMDTDRYGTATTDEDYEDDAIEDVETGAAVPTAPIPSPVGYTEQELAAAAEMSRMLTSDKFKEILLKDKYMGITDKYLIENFNIRKNEQAECGYAITCYARIKNKTASRDVYVTADAKSGKIMEFHSSGDNGSKTELIPAKAAKLAAEAARYYYGDIIGEYRADPENSAPVPAAKDRQITVRSRQMIYHRYVNNIQVQGNNITVTVNSAGKVTGISMYHDRDADFGDGLIITREQALELLCKAKDMKLWYDGFTDLDSVPHTYLHYTMGIWYLNAKTGKLCDYFGGADKNPDTSGGYCPYTDISGSKYKSEIETLYLCGVQIYTGRQFKPDEKMTRSELESLMSLISRNGYEPVMPLEVVEDDSAKAADNASKSDPYVTRLELAKEFTKAAGVDNCAGFTSVFRSPFKDVSGKDKDLGYIALAYALGGAQGESDGKFYPNAAVTRGYAYHCVYNYIERGQEGSAK